MIIFLFLRGSVSMSRMFGNMNSVLNETHNTVEGISAGLNFNRDKNNINNV